MNKAQEFFRTNRDWVSLDMSYLHVHKVWRSAVETRSAQGQRGGGNPDISLCMDKKRKSYSAVVCCEGVHVGNLCNPM